MPAFRFPGNVGFLIYVADSFGYLGSVEVLISKEVLRVKLQWTSFYSHGVPALSVLGIAGAIISLTYFRSKYKKLVFTGRNALPALPMRTINEKLGNSVPS
ncbi:MAG: DUF5690 family protein [Bacteroidota bacterium]|nr:DUF5690 family protein [Bacteroidota bacterium]MDP4213683.1 DUF5690 family protein [Bacteroidota bacterium]MDP4250313.1 DUF5690 family protein [Bacteroidota bacterium]